VADGRGLLGAPRRCSGKVAVGRPDELVNLAQTLANETPGFFEIKGSGAGNLATNAYVGELRIRAALCFGVDLAEQSVCGTNNLRVDYYFEPEATIVEIALGLRNPNTEFEKDVLKAVMAKDQGRAVERLLLVSKQGGRKKCNQPGRREVVSWSERSHGIRVEVHDLVPNVCNT